MTPYPSQCRPKPVGPRRPGSTRSHRTRCAPRARSPSGAPAPAYTVWQILLAWSQYVIQLDSLWGPGPRCVGGHEVGLRMIFTAYYGASFRSSSLLTQRKRRGFTTRVDDVAAEGDIWQTAPRRGRPRQQSPRARRRSGRCPPPPPHPRRCPRARRPPPPARAWLILLATSSNALSTLISFIGWHLVTWRARGCSLIRPRLLN